MSEMDPQKRAKQEVAPRHIPQVVVPVRFDEVREFVRRALKGTSLVDSIAQVATGWVLFEPHLRYTAVDEAHTRIELDLVGRLPGADALLYTRRVGEIDRFFVAIQDELDERDERERRRSRPPTGSAAIEGAD